MNQQLHSGDTAPKSGTYNVYNESGKILGTVRVQQGETMPPTQWQGSHFEFSDSTN